MKFYTSDLHFNHGNIIRYENRPFDTVEEMNETLIRNWNRKVKKGDEVYILGDFTFSDGKTANELLKRLNGNKYLVKGNHDSFVKDKEFDRSLLVWVKDYASIHDGRFQVILFHFPIAVWDNKHHDSVHLYGHVHGNSTTSHPLLFPLENAYNVGVDANGYEPKTLEELMRCI